LLWWLHGRSGVFNARRAAEVLCEIGKELEAFAAVGDQVPELGVGLFYGKPPATAF
jgi:hypothetical protein